MADTTAPIPPERSLYQKFEDQMKNTAISAQKAIEWFKANAQLLTGMNANVLMTRNRQRLIPTATVDKPMYTGRMIMFFYNPKYRNEPKILPYYDMFPLVMIIKTFPDGFLGINLHYLPIMYRAKLLDRIHEIYRSREYDENKKLQMNYNILNSITGTKYFKPCLKRYLYSGNDYRGGGVTSRFYLVDPNEWDKMLALPTERFVRKTASQVQSESLQKLGVRKH